MDEKEAEARPIMGTIFLVYIYIHMSVCLRETHTKNTYGKMRGQNSWPKYVLLKVSFGRLKPTCGAVTIYIYMYVRPDNQYHVLAHCVRTLTH